MLHFAEDGVDTLIFPFSLWLSMVNAAGDWKDLSS